MKYCYMLIAFLAFSLCSAQDEPINYADLEGKPEYPGGIKEFYSYINKSFHVPQLENDTELRILLSFVVERDGSMGQMKVLKETISGIGQEAMRVLKDCPTKWKPGVMNGQPVRANYILPIIIKVKGTGKPVPQTQDNPAPPQKP